MGVSEKKTLILSEQRLQKPTSEPKLQELTTTFSLLETGLTGILMLQYDTPMLWYAVIKHTSATQFCKIYSPSTLLWKHYLQQFVDVLYLECPSSVH